MKHQSRVVAELRKQILNGEIKPGQRLAEIPLAESFSVSRTPIRHALTILEQEGYLTRDDSRSYLVRSYRVGDVIDAIEVRGVLEGLAARQIAEHGISRPLLLELKACLAEGDTLLDKDTFGDEEQDRYFSMNDRFHAAIIEGSGNTALMDALNQNDKIPFASAASVAFHRNTFKDNRMRSLFAHTQHHHVVEAIEAGESARAEALMKEHAQVGKRGMNLYSEDPATREKQIYPGMKLSA